MSMRPRALTALTRFGLGPRPGEIAMIADDPVGYVKEQCMAPEAALLTQPNLESRVALRQQYVTLDNALRQIRKGARKAGIAIDQEAEKAALTERREFSFGALNKEIAARFDHGVRTDSPFVERLVLFWSNHFAINRKSGPGNTVLMGNFEREAIRPYVLGYFEDMLAAATTHPAMLNYLDNTKNIGPNSVIGKRRKRTSVNENLARELLELHTLGAGGGYTQADVIALAETLTGWMGGLEGDGAGASFSERFHEFGPRTIMGTDYPEEGAGQLEMVLSDLAIHPSTAHHIATKFARHFVGDEVSDTLIAELEDTFLVTGGDLRELALVLLESDAAWTGEAAKTVPPYDFMVGAMRATNAKLPDVRFISRSAMDLAQPMWQPPSPAGWPDDDGAFLGGDSLLERIDFCRLVAARFARVDRAQDLARELFGEALDPFVAEAVDRAEDQRQALVLILMSPPFHRR